MFEGDDDSLIRFAGSPAFQAPEAITGNMQWINELRIVWMKQWRI